MTAPTLSVSNLSVMMRGEREGEPDWRSVVHAASFELQPRETLALVGGSGSGKSVSSLAIMRLLDPARTRTAGDVWFDGLPLLSAPRETIRHLRGGKIAMIFQEPMTSLNPLIPIGRQIAEVVMARGDASKSVAKARALDMLKRVAIPSAETRFADYPHQFSGGQRQRILIAMALVCNPELLIADEPTTALDVTVQAQILQLLRDLQEERGMAMLFITHDMGVVSQVADRVVVMHKGKTIETGSTIDIFERPKNPYTRSLLSAVPRLGEMQGELQPLPFPIEGQAAKMQTGPTVIATDDPILVVRNLVKDYPKRTGMLKRVASKVCAVNDVSFAIRPGETLSLVGESGCGKSTTGRAIMRLQDPTSGEVLFAGEPLNELSGKALRSRRSDIQMVFQDPYSSLNPRLRIGKALLEPMLAHGRIDRSDGEKRVRELLEMVGLDADMADRFPNEFSGGQRQRISIARALSLNPKLIVADEAVSALDVIVKAQVVNLLMELQQSLRLAYLFISHDMTVVERISHRVAVMSAGRIVEIGSRDAIFGAPRHSYTRKLLSSVPIADPRRKGGVRETIPAPVASKTPSACGPGAACSHLRQVGPDHYALEEI